jgi:hypothetical protein
MQALAKRPVLVASIDPLGQGELRFHPCQKGGGREGLRRRRRVAVELAVGLNINSQLEGVGFDGGSLTGARLTIGGFV